MESTTLLDPAWRDASRYLKYFAWFIVLSIVGGIAAGHIPILFFKEHWSTCRVSGSQLGCLIMVHVWGVPMIGFSAFFAWYVFKRFSKETGHLTRALLMLTLAVNLVYFAFETGLILDSLRREAHAWETMVLGGIAVALAIGITFGIIVHQKLVKALFPPVK